MRYPWHATYHFRPFLFTITMEISTFHFRTSTIQACFLPTKTMGMINIIEHCVGKYSPWYEITPYLLYQDRPAAARRCVCLYSCSKVCQSTDRLQEGDPWSKLQETHVSIWHDNSEKLEKKTRTYIQVPFIFKILVFISIILPVYKYTYT